MIRSLLTLCICWTTIFGSLGQQFDHYTVNNGLPANMVYRISQDSKGFIWIITERGIARYDGRNFKVFGTKDGLPTNDIWELAITSDDRVWYFSKSASMGYIRNDSIYDFPSSEANKILFPSNINEQQNEVTFGYNQVWYGLENNLWQPLTGDKSDHHSNYLELHNNFISSKNGEYGRPISRRIDSIAVIFGPKQFAVLNVPDETIKEFDYPAELRDKNFSFFRAHKVNGQIQLTGQGFVAELDMEQGMVNVDLFPDDLESHFAFKDSFGNYWLASLTRGMYKLPANKRNSVYSLQEQRVRGLIDSPMGTIASITDRGFYIIDEDAESSLISAGSGFVYTAEYIPELMTTYLLSAREVMSIDEAGIRKTHRPVARNLLLYDGFLYGNVSGGLNKLTKDLEQITMYREVGIKTLTVWNDQLYLGTSSGPKRFTGSSIESVTEFSEIVNKPILDMLTLPDERLVLSTDGFGIYILDQNAARLLEGSEYSSANQIYVKGKQLWLATDNGLLNYELNETSVEFKQRIGTGEGLPNPVINSVLLKNGSLIVGTDNGLAVIPENQTSASQVSHIFVSEAAMNGSKIPDGDAFRFSKENPLNIEVGLVDLGNDLNGSNYSYKLEPIQSSWTDTQASNLSFSSLAPGDYTLRLRAGEVSSSYSFVVLPLWWQRDLSLIAIGIAVMALIIFAMQQYRKYELKKKMSKLEVQNKLTEFELYALRSQMNPHFVFNSLAAIQYCINNNQVELAEKYLVKFSRLVRQFFELSKQKEVDLESEIELLRNYLDIEKLRFKEKLDYSVRVTPELASKNPKIPTMLLQPIVENAINHGIFNKRNGGRVDIDFTQLEDSTLIVEIADNGVGMKATAKSLNGKRTSSDVLNERIGFLNKGGNWTISYDNKAAFPTEKDQGNITTFMIKPEA